MRRYRIPTGILVLPLTDNKPAILPGHSSGEDTPPSARLTG